MTKFKINEYYNNTYAANGGNAGLRRIKRNSCNSTVFSIENLNVSYENVPTYAGDPAIAPRPV